MNKIILKIIIATIVIAVAAVGFKLQTTDSVDPVHLSPYFVYDNSSSSEWWSSGNLSPQTTVDESQYDSELNGPISELPVANISVHHGGPEGLKFEDNCFVSFFYYNFPLNDGLESGYGNFESSMDKWGSFELLEKTQQTLQTYLGDKTYELRSYRTEAEGGGEYLSGNMIGFIQLDGSHLKINAVCKTPENLELIKPILPSVKLEF